MVNNLLLIYGFKNLGEEQIQQMEKFDYVIISSYYEQAEGLFFLKQRKPSIRILIYQNAMAMSETSNSWEIANSHEDWFIHDINGNRVKNANWGWYLMDVGNQEYIDFCINRVLIDLQSLPMVFGVFMDDVWGYLKAFWTVPDENIPEEVKDRWHSNQLNMIIKFKSVLKNKILIINSQERTNDYIHASDGVMIEGFVHPSWWSVDVWGYDSWNVIDHINELVYLSNLNKIILIHDGATFTDINSAEEIEKFRQIWFYSLGAYLLASNFPTSIGFGNWWNDPFHGYQPEMELNLGFPFGSYYVKDNIYIRNFSKCKVLVNLSLTNTYSTIINGKNIILLPHSIEIIPMFQLPLGLLSKGFSFILGTTLTYFSSRI